MNLESIAENIITLANEEFEKMISYIEITDINEEDKTITFTCDVEGGYEADVNAYYGGDEYVEDFINTIDIDDSIKFKAEYDLDQSDMVCKLILTFD